MTSPDAACSFCAERDLPAQGYGDLVRSEISALRRRLND